MSRGRLMRYGIEQLRDWLTVRGFGILLLLAVSTAGAAMSMHGKYGDGWADGPEGRERVRQMIVGIFAGQALLVAIVASSGIVSNDRKAGFTRFLFAKPVSPPAYYGQAFLMALVGVLVTLLVYLAGAAVVWRAVLPWGAIGGVLAATVSMGGIIFLLSTLVQLDVIIFGGLLAIGALGGALLSASAPALVPWVSWIFPPLSLGTELTNTLAQGVTPSWNLVTWVVGYGVGCLAMGLVVLRRRAIAG